MKQIKILTMLTAFLFISFTIKAQDTTKPFYFPHKTGDMWEYFYDDYSPLYVDTLQNFTLFSSVDSRGVIYIKQHAQFINPTESAVVLSSDTAKYWIDTLSNCVYSNSLGHDSSLVYKLNAKKGDQWIVAKGGWFHMARVMDKWEGSIFGRNTTFMSIAYYFTQDSTDTTGYSIFDGDLIADGFGLIARGGGGKDVFKNVIFILRASRRQCGLLSSLKFGVQNADDFAVVHDISFKSLAQSNATCPPADAP